MKKNFVRSSNIEYTCKQSVKLFRKESFTFWRHYCERTDNGDEFSTTQQEAINNIQVYNQYRSKHHVPFPSEIRQIRLQYGLSAAKMAEVLDFGINSYRQYESGVMPSLAHAKLIRLAKDPNTFYTFAKEKEHLFSQAMFKRLQEQISHLKEQDYSGQSLEYRWNQHQEANEFTGFVKPDLKKVAYCILFLAGKANPLKTRLNKLLFYCDFLNYKRTGYSISGCNYRAIQMGPVPSHYHELFGMLESMGYIRIEEELYDHGGTGERFFPLQSFDPEQFNDQELTTMQDIVNIFDDLRTREIIEISHQEKGWMENKDRRDLISYQAYAFDLQGV